jgi:hypothetical protein
MDVMLVGGESAHNARYVGKLATMGLDVVRRWDADGRQVPIVKGIEAVLVMHDHMSHSQYNKIKKLCAMDKVPMVHVSKKMSLTKRVLQEVLGMGFKEKKDVKLVPTEKGKRGGSRVRRTWTRDEILLIHGMRHNGCTWDRIASHFGVSNTGVRTAYRREHEKLTNLGFARRTLLDKAGEKAYGAWIASLHPEARGATQGAKDGRPIEVSASADLDEPTWHELADEASEANDALRAEITALKEEAHKFGESMRSENRRHFLKGVDMCHRFNRAGVGEDLEVLLNYIAHGTHGVVE